MSGTGVMAAEGEADVTEEEFKALGNYVRMWRARGRSE